MLHPATIIALDLGFEGEIFLGRRVKVGFYFECCATIFFVRFKGGFALCFALYSFIYLLIAASSSLVNGRLLIMKSTPSGSFMCPMRSEEHTSELQSLRHLVCRLL